MAEFGDIKAGFRQVLSDRQWLWKVLLGGFLLINPFLLALAPAYVAGVGDPARRVDWVQDIFPYILVFNILSFWFPLGFTFEVLRRARQGSGPQLPDWSFERLPRYAYEGAIKLLISVFTLLVPVGLWMGLCGLVFCAGLGLPASILSLFLPVILVLVIPFCGVACCRWLDGDSVLSCALNYARTARIFRARWKDFMLASLFLTGLNTVTTGLFYTIPFAALFGLCLVDTWFGPIYADAARAGARAARTAEEKTSATFSSEALPS